MNLFYFLLFLFSSFFLNKIWRSILSNKMHYFLMVPGMIVHEISHVLGCFLAGAKVKEVKLFSKKGGYVVHLKPRLKIVGKIIIALAPIIVGSGISLLIANNLGLNFKEFKIEKLFTVSFWVYFILVTSILIEMIPSKADLRNAIGGISFIALIGVILYYFEISNIFLYLLSSSSIKNFLFLIISLEIILLVVSLPLYLIKIIFSYNK